MSDENSSRIQKIIIGNLKEILENPRSDYFKSDFIEFEFSIGDTTRFE